MGSPLAIDWQDMHVLALAIGLREAIRQKGLEKHEAAIMQRSAREDWFGKRKAAQALLTTNGKHEIIAQASGKDVSSVSKVLSAAEILANLGPDSKSKLAIAGNKAVTKLAQMDADELLVPEVAQTAKTWSGTLATAHGWQQEGQTGSATVVNIAFLAPQSHEDARAGLVVDVDGQDSAGT